MSKEQFAVSLGSIEFWSFELSATAPLEIWKYGTFYDVHFIMLKDQYLTFML